MSPIDASDKCQASPTGRHEPDWSTVIIDYDGEAYVDVSCIHCGRSGCVGSAKTLADDICW